MSQPTPPSSPPPPPRADAGSPASAASNRTFYAISLALLLIITITIGLKMPPERRFTTWCITMILLGLFTVLAGRGVTGLWRGAFIDERNKVSLSRIQLFLWTVVVLAGLLVVGLSNAALGDSAAVDIAIPEEIWVLLGISTVSLVGSPLIRSTKETKPPNEAEFESTRRQLSAVGVNPETVEHRGQILVNLEPADSRWSDLVKGEETGNGAHLDLAKIQLLFFTAVLVVIYAAALGRLLKGSFGAIHEFPPISDGMVTLLGISHAGYLSNKAVSHSEPPGQ